MIENQVGLLRTWEESLRRSGHLRLAEDLRDAVIDPAAADAETCWSAMWNKPLYANTKVAIGARYEAVLADLMPGAWRYMGRDPLQFGITYTGEGRAMTASSSRASFP